MPTHNTVQRNTLIPKILPLTAALNMAVADHERQKVETNYYDEQRKKI